MTEPADAIVSAVVAWPMVLGFALLVRGRQRLASAGLVPAYLFNLSLLHWLGTAIYTLPWYVGRDVTIIQAGLAQSLNVLVAFSLGAAFVAPALLRLWHKPGPTSVDQPPEQNLASIYLAVGLACYFVLAPLLGQIPTVASLVSNGLAFLAAGLGLASFNAWRAGRSRELFLWLAVTLSLPFVTIIMQGFIGFGIAATMAVVMLIATLYRPRWKVVVAMLVLGYVGLSLFTTYMRDRSVLRAVIWGGERLEQRLDSLQQTIVWDPLESTCRHASLSIL